MPPKPLPWDRKDFFKERKHERVEPPGRWRDSSLYHNGASREFNRLGSADFRRPPGHAKQGDWHLYGEDSCNGYAESRYNEKMLENESIRSYNSRLEGKYARNGCRDGRGCYSYRDGHDWEVKNGSPDKSTRPHDVNSEKRSADDILTYATKSHSDYQATCDHVHLKEQADSKATSFSAMGPVQKCNETSVCSVDWKHRKWSRSGSMSSRGSGFSHSSSSKSLGIDSLEDKAELQPKVAGRSSVMDSSVCGISVAPVDEMISRKKQRLGWGEGLAKYEKKKVEVPDTSMSGAGATAIFSNSEPNRSISSDLVEKSPRILGFSDCASPATPSSVACSSSPGLDEKSFMKAVSVDDVSNFCVSPGIGSQSHLESLPFNLEKLDASSFANLGSSLADLLQSDNPCLSDTGFVRSTALNKLLMWKSDSLKALEMTETEIDLLENQLKSLKAESHIRISSAAEIDSLPLEQNLEPCTGNGPKLMPISRSSSLEVYPLLDVDKGKTPDCNVDLGANIAVKEEEIDSPGTATSKFMELAPPFKATSLSEQCKELCCYEDMNALKSTSLEVTSMALHRVNGFAATSCHGDDINIANLNSERLAYMDNGVDIETGFHNTLLENNKELAGQASEVLHKLLPNGSCSTGTSGDSFLSSLHNDLHVRENIVMHRLSSKFKERVLALKYKVLHFQWKEDLRLLSERKYRAKYQKKCEASLRVMTNGQQKFRSSNRSRFAYPAGNLNLVPTKDVINFARKMLSEPQVKLCRNSLRMPSLILDKRERLASRFITNNGLIQDPLAVEKERSMINPWTSEEKEIFMNKLAMFGKDFRKIASFLEHKTTADCVEFYYKNHKSDGFEIIKKPDLSKRKSANSTYLVTAGAKWNREMSSASLDILGAASVIAANAETSISNRKLSSGRIFSGGQSDTKGVQIDEEITERSSGIDIAGCDRETVAADVLAGICGSISSEAMSSCITCSVDAGEGSHDWMCQKVDSVLMRPSTSDVTQSVDEDTCSDESCGELDSADWTDEEKSVFIQAVSSYGKDFTMISRTVGTRTRDQCRIFFSKARKCLGLDSLHSRAVRRKPLSDGTNGGGSDTEDACVLESSVVGSEKSGLKADEDPPIVDVNQCESDATTNVNLEIDLNTTEDSKRAGGLDNAFSHAFVTKESSSIQLDDVVDHTSELDDCLLNVNRCSSSLEMQNNTETTVGQIEEISTDEGMHVVVPVSVGEAVKPCYPSSDASVTCKSAGGCSTVQGGIELEIRESVSPKSSGAEWGKKCLTGISSGNSVAQYPDSVVTCENFCRLSNAASSANLHQVPIELNTGIKTLGISLPEENAFPDKMSVVHHSDAKDESPSLSLHEENAFAAEMSIAYCPDDKDESSSRDDFSYIRQPCSSTPLQSAPSVSQRNDQTERELSGDISSRLIPDAQRMPKTGSVVSSLCAPQECFLRKCNGPKTYSSIAELPLLSQNSPQTGDQRKARSRSLSDTEKPCRHGNVKLFGQILNSGSHEAEDKANEKPTISKSAGLLGMDGSSSVLNFSRDSHSKMENVPIRSYSFWDGSRIQTGLSSLPDSSMLMAKYPAAFGNFSTSSFSRKEQQLPVTARNNDQNFSNGVSAFSSREVNTSSGLMDHQVYRSCDPADTKQQSVMPPGFQQQGKGGIVGLNVLGGRGGILVSGPCTSVLDPVVAMRLHFAKTEQYGSSQKGSGIRGDDSSWICKGGDIGR